MKWLTLGPDKWQSCVSNSDLCYSGPYSSGKYTDSPVDTNTCTKCPRPDLVTETTVSFVLWYTSHWSQGLGELGGQLPVQLLPQVIWLPKASLYLCFSCVLYHVLVPQLFDGSPEGRGRGDDGSWLLIWVLPPNPPTTTLFFQGTLLLVISWLSLNFQPPPPFLEPLKSY